MAPGAPSNEVLDNKIDNLTERVESHDIRHSASIAELKGEVAVLRGEIVEQKIFKAQVVILAGLGSIIGSVIIAIGQALINGKPH